jgi:hypothetical protein
VVDGGVCPVRDRCVVELRPSTAGCSRCGLGYQRRDPEKAGLTVVSETQAMKQALTPQTAGKRYLKVGVFGDRGTEAGQDAVRTFAVGCFTAIRNPAAHAAGPDWDEQFALEYLAALSVLARWIDGADVVTC